MGRKIEENFVRSKNNASLVDTLTFQMKATIDLHGHLLDRIDRLEEKRKPNIWESRAMFVGCNGGKRSTCKDGHLWDVIHGGWYCKVDGEWEYRGCKEELSFCDKEGKCSRKFTITGIEENVSCD
jgi:hypothetical protein